MSMPKQFVMASPHMEVTCINPHFTFAHAQCDVDTGRFTWFALRWAILITAAPREYAWGYWQYQNCKSPASKSRPRPAKELAAC